MFFFIRTPYHEYPFGAGILHLNLEHPVFKMWIIQEQKSSIMK